MTRHGDPDPLTVTHYAPRRGRRTPDGEPYLGCGDPVCAPRVPDDASVRCNASVELVTCPECLRRLLAVERLNTQRLLDLLRGAADALHEHAARIVAGTAT
jgi:hypothetical protein